MSKAYLAGFVLVAGLGLAGVDYVNQSRRVGAGLMEFGPKAYVASIGERYIWQRNTMAAAALRSELRSMDGRDHLPEAPEGWTRRDFTDADRARLYPAETGLEDVPKEVTSHPVVAAMLLADEKLSKMREATDIWVYENGDEVILLRLAYQPPSSGGINAPFVNMIANNMEMMQGKRGFAIIQGVTFREELGLFGGIGSDPDARPSYRVYTANLAEQLRIGVRTNASDETVVALLDKIDFDRLNGLFETPIPGIGSAAPKIAPEDQRALADAAVNRDSAARMANAIDEQAKLMSWADDMAKRNGWTAAGAGGDAAAMIEIGKMATEIETMITLDEKAGRAAPEMPVADQTAPAGAAKGIGALLSMFTGGKADAETGTGAAAAAETAEGDQAPQSSGVCVRRAGILTCE